MIRSNMIYKRFSIIYLKTARCNGTDFIAEEPQVRQTSESIKHSWFESATPNVLDLLSHNRILLRYTFKMYVRRVYDEVSVERRWLHLLVN